jgi:hypothetical protein
MSLIGDAWDWYAAHSDKVNPIVAGLGGAALVWAAVRQARTATNRHYEQTRADQQRRLTESFSKAVEQLTSDKMEARLGGIYTLERLALEAIAQVRLPGWWMRLRRNRQPPADPVSDLYWTVMETLTAFVRERSRWKEPEASASGIMAEPDLWQSRSQSDPNPQPSEPKPSTDIAAVLEVIRRRPDAGQMREKRRGWHFDLSTTDLRGADLGSAHLERADLSGAHLERASLGSAHLEGADLSRAHLERADLDSAHLERADLGSAHLERARLYGVHLECANLNEARLEGANLNEAHLKRARLYGTHLEGASLQTAHLEGTELRGVIGDAGTRLPDGRARPTGWPAYAPKTDWWARLP